MSDQKPFESNKAPFEAIMTLAIDVGISTGLVLAEITTKRVPTVLVTATLAHGSKEFEEMRDHLYAQIMTFGVDAVIIEPPLLNVHSTYQRETAQATANWRVWWTTKFVQTPSLIISAADWKSTPAKRIDVLKTIQEVKGGYKPTRHERDAAAMLYWASFWGSSRISHLLSKQNP